MSRTSRSIGFRAGAVFAAAIGLSLTACGDDGGQATPKANDANNGQSAEAGKTASFGVRSTSTATSSEYVGEVSGTDALAAFLVVRDNDSKKVTNGMAYFCDGSKIADWFHLTGASGDTLHFASNKGATFDAKLDGDKVTATLNLGTLNGSTTATKVPSDGAAGLFLADASVEPTLTNDERAGWIVLADGRQKGALKSPSTITAGSALGAGATSVTAGGRSITLLGLTSISDPAPWF